MAKRSADDFFNEKQQSSSGSKSTKMSADDFFNRTSKEINEELKVREEKKLLEGSRAILNNTIKSVTKPIDSTVTSPVETPKTVDFKQDQANKKASVAAAPDPFSGKTLAPITPNITNDISSTLQGKVPAASLLQQTGKGPANASHNSLRTEYDIREKAIDDTNIPEILKLPSRAMNKLAFGNPVGRFVSNSFTGNSGVTQRDSTGSKAADKVTDIINEFVTPLLTPTGAPVGQGIIGSSYDATAKALSGKAGQTFLKGASKVIPGSQNVAKVAATEGIAGSLQGVGFGLQQGQDSGNEIARNAFGGAAAGLVLGGASAALGELGTSLLSRFRKSGIPESEIAEIAPELLALPEANPRTVRKQLAGEIKTTPSGDTISTPYTFRLNEATPETAAATANRQAMKNYDPIELSTKYAQDVIDEYKTLKETNSKKISNKKLYEQARQNVDTRRVTDSPIVESKLKDTNIKATDPTPYTEPVIRNPVQELSREQQIQNKVNAGEFLPQEDIDFLLSGKYDKSKAFPDETPTTSTYVKPKSELVPKTEIKPAKPKAKLKPVNKEVAATTEVAATKNVKRALEVPKENVPAKKQVRESKTEGIRSNYKTVQESGNISPELKSRVEGSKAKTYTIFKDAEANRLANENVKNIELAESKFFNNKYEGKESIATGYRLSQELDKLANATNDENLKEALFGRALAALDKTIEDLTKAGQTSQAGSLIQRMSPEGQLQNLIRKAKANNLEVKVADSVKFKQEATKYVESVDAGIQENEVSEIFSRLESGTATPDDIKNLKSYMDNARSKINLTEKPVKDKLNKELSDVRKRDKVVSFLEAQEAAAKARIEKRRGRLNSLPVEEWIDYSILISSKVARGVIKAETYVEDLVKLFGEDIKPIAREVFEKAQELVNSVSKGSIEGDFLKADKAFKRITGSNSLSQLERIVESYVKANPKVTIADIESLRKLSKSITELQGTQKLNADMEMQKILNSYEKSSVNDKINAIRYMSMLFNDATQSINAISGPMMATMGTTFDVLGSMVDIAMKGVLKTERTTTLYGTNPLRFIANYFKYAKIGGKAGWEGVNPSGIQGTNEIRGLAFKSKKNPLGIIERSLGAVAKGADYATYKTVYETELRKQGFLDAIKNGVKRSDKEGLKNHIRKFMNDPPIEAAEQADRIGKNTTFQRSDTTAGKVANWLNAAPKGVKPAVNAVIPFVRTPLNIASQAATLTPFGILKGMFQLSSLSKASQREALRTLSMGITGGVGMTSLGYYLSSLGIITGANDTGNKDVNNINEQAGRGKYRFNTSALKRYMDALIGGEGAEAAEKAAKYQKGDMAFDYNKLQPLALPLAAGAAFNEKKGSIGTKLAGSASDSFGSLFGMSSLKGIQDTFQPQYTGTEGDKNINIVNRVIESYFKSFSPSILAQEARRQDPVSRKTTYNEGLKKDLSTYFMSRTPGLSKKLPENKDSLGNTKMNPEGFVGQHLNPYKSQTANYTAAAGLIADVIERTGDKTIAPKAPAKDFSGYDDDGEKVTITLPTKRYEQLQEDTGAEITKRIMEIESNNDDEIIEAIKEIYSEVKAEQRDKLREEYELSSK